jgi:hypothetical protein
MVLLFCWQRLLSDVFLLILPIQQALGHSFSCLCTPSLTPLFSLLRAKLFHKEGSMRRLFLLLCFLFLSLPAHASDLVDMSKTRWGMDKKSTAKAIGISLPKGDAASSPVLLVKGFELAGYDASMGYVFDKTGLSEVFLRVESTNNPSFSVTKARDLADRLKRQFSRNHGNRLATDAPCVNTPQCTYSYWRKDDKTDVAVYLTEELNKRTLAISYTPTNNDASSNVWDMPGYSGIFTDMPADQNKQTAPPKQQTSKKKENKTK